MWHVMQKDLVRYCKKWEEKYDVCNVRLSKFPIESSFQYTTHYLTFSFTVHSFKASFVTQSWERIKCQLIRDLKTHCISKTKSDYNNRTTLFIIKLPAIETKMLNLIALSVFLLIFIGLPIRTESFLSPFARRVGAPSPSRTTLLKADNHRQGYFQFDDDRDDTDSDSIINCNTNKNLSRRSMLENGSKLLSVPFLMNSMHIEKAHAIVGTLPEFSDTNGVLQGITIDVADLTQQEDMINFLRDGLSFKVLRQRKLNSVTETVGFVLIISK